MSQTDWSSLAAWQKGSLSGLVSAMWVRPSPSTLVRSNHLDHLGEPGVFCHSFDEHFELVFVRVENGKAGQCVGGKVILPRSPLDVQHELGDLFSQAS